MAQALAATGAVHGLKVRAIDLELMVTGLPGLDIDDWRRNTVGNLMSDVNYGSLCEWFWEVLNDMTLEDKAKLLAFTCGSSRLPAGGFGALKPKAFNVDVTAEPTENLPIAHTCFNQLQIPHYTTKGQLQERLYKALEMDAGFGFM